MRTAADVRSDFDLDPAVVHLNHGAYGVAPRRVEQAQQRLSHRAAADPYRFHRAEVGAMLPAARAALCEFVGVGPDEAALVRIAGQAYNDAEDYRRLAAALLSLSR